MDQKLREEAQARALEEMLQAVLHYQEAGGRALIVNNLWFDGDCRLGVLLSGAHTDGKQLLVGGLIKG